MNFSAPIPMLHHCVTTLNRQGGAQTYIQALLKHQLGATEQPIINLFEVPKQSQFQLLHLHDPKQLNAFREECPAVISLHNHSPYCPSGTQYFSTHQMCCDRPMSTLGCVWGHLVDGCGSRRPANIYQGLRTSQQEITHLQQKRILVIANSDYVRDRLIRQGLPPDRVVTLHLGTEDRQQLATPLTPEIHRMQRLLFVGRVVPTKGVEWLLRSLALVNPAIHLDIAGDGWFRPQAERLAATLGIQSRITWHGWCQADELSQLYEQCFAVVFPSVWPEPAGLITLEAYSHHRPVIASAVGGIPEYAVHGKTGLLVEPNHPRQLAAAMTQLAEHHQTCSDLARQGYTYYQSRFTLTTHIKALNQIYDRAIDLFTKKLGDW